MFMLQYSQNAQIHVHFEPNKNCLSPLCTLLPKGPTALLPSPHLLLHVVFDHIQDVPFVNAPPFAVVKFTDSANLF